MTRDAPVIAVCGALWWEVRPVVRALAEVRKVRLGRLQTWQGTSALGRVVVFRAGMGPDLAAQAAESLLEEIPVSVLLNTGCCGALAAGLRRGALVVPDALRFLHLAQVAEFKTDSSWTARLREAAEGRCDAGPQVTSTAILRLAAEKQAARERSGASAVDMEGAALARVAAEYGTPFASVRAVLDEAGADLPDLTGLTDAAGDVSPLRAAARAMVNPSKIKEFLSLRAAAREAERGLEKFFKKLFHNRG